MGLELKGFIFVGGSGGGTPSVNNFVWNENHSSEIDGIKYIFTCNNPYVTGWTKIKYNGQELTLGLDYTETDNIDIELTFIPVTGDILTFDYLKI